MESKISAPWTTGICVVAGAIFLMPFATFALTNDSLSHSTASVAPSLASQEMAHQNPEFPVRLMIPIIAVDEGVEQVGLTTSGAMDAPKGPTGVGWFNLSPFPGKAGNAVIDGHFGWKDGVSAAFNNLYQLHTGDKIYVKNEDGVTYTFMVRDVQTYGADEDVSNLFASNDKKAHLTLITCEGEWNKSEKRYADRLVVFADRL